MEQTIAIVGAGIGGLAAASLLADLGHTVTVFDQFDQPRPVGSGLVIQPVGQTVLDSVGVLDLARRTGAPIRRMLGHEADSGRTVLDVWYDRAGTDRAGLAIHRGALFAALLEGVQRREVALVAAARVSGAERGHLTFADGRRRGPFDLIVDASGAGSPLSPLRSRPLPYGAIWGTVDWPQTDLPGDELRQSYRRADRMMGVLPIGAPTGAAGRKAAIFWSMPAGAYDDWRAQGLAAWRTEAAALWPAFAAFAAQITDPEQMTMARYGHGTLSRPWSPGLVHIGDAAHRASPQLGQGANMALLDAFALAEALRLAKGDAALALYARARRWHVRIYQAMSAVFTPQYQSDSRWLPALRDRVLFPASQIGPLPRLLSAIVCGTMVRPLGSMMGRGALG